MPSGQAYTKGVRMVKTCVGTEFCRFGTQDSTSAGIELERRLENLFTPHKFKMAMVGCPRNCAEATVKDIGLVGQEGSWQVVVGGAAGKSVRKADLLITVETTEQALEAAELFFQYYRENANYLERTLRLRRAPRHREDPQGNRVRARSRPPRAARQAAQVEGVVVRRLAGRPVAGEPHAVHPADSHWTGTGRGRMSDIAKTWVRVASCDAVPPREGRAAIIGSREIAIFNLGDRYVAMDNRCPHQSGPLCDGIVAGDAVVCPLHAWKVKLDTGVVARPAYHNECVRTYRTRVEDGIVWLGLPLAMVTAAPTGKHAA